MIRPIKHIIYISVISILILSLYLTYCNVNLLKKGSPNLLSSADYPNVIIVALPKSASQYIKTVMSQGLQYSVQARNRWVNPGYAESFNNTGAKLIKLHIFPTDENLEKLRKYTDQKIMLHVRDPRATVLSGAHFQNRKCLENKTRKNGTPDKAKEAWCDRYTDLTFEQQIDYLIEVRLPGRVRWVKDWLIVKSEEDRKKDGLQIKLTTYDELLIDEEKFFDNIVKHFGIEKSKFKFIPIVKDVSVNYRIGDKDEWRRVYTPEQMAKINKIVPRELLDRFNWAY